MQKISMAVSLAGLGLMLAGFIDLLFNGFRVSLPGRAVLPLPMLAHLSEVPLSLAGMSAGILLLALLPLLRVLLAFWLYLRSRDLLNAAAALVVILELFVSIIVGG